MLFRRRVIVETLMWSLMVVEVEMGVPSGSNYPGSAFLCFFGRACAICGAESSAVVGKEGLARK